MIIFDELLGVYGISNGNHTRATGRNKANGVRGYTHVARDIAHRSSDSILRCWEPGHSTRMFFHGTFSLFSHFSLYFCFPCLFSAGMSIFLVSHISFLLDGNQAESTWTDHNPSSIALLIQIRIEQGEKSKLHTQENRV